MILSPNAFRGTIHMTDTTQVTRVRACAMALAIWAAISFTAYGQDFPYLTTAKPVTLLSANDGDVLPLIDPEMEYETKDSITVVRLSPDQPPWVKTVYDTVPNTISGPPHMAISRNGRYGFVTSHSLGVEVDNVGTGHQNRKPFVAEPEPNVVSVIDLASDGLTVVKKIPLPPYPLMSVTHPKDNRILVGGGNFFHVFTVNEKSQAIEVETCPSPLFITGFDISPCGKKIIATGILNPKKEGNPFVDWDIVPHVFDWDEEGIHYRGSVMTGTFEDPFNGSFSPRFGPFGKRVYVLNGLGIAGRSVLDEMIVIDMERAEPAVCAIVPQIADGPESLAVSPDGKMAVVGCVERTRGVISSHLAVIDLKQMQILYHIPVEPIPEGIDFTEDGKQLCVGCTGVYRIVVFDVVGDFRLQRRPEVIRTGHCHASLAIGPTYEEPEEPPSGQ